MLFAGKAYKLNAGNSGSHAAESEVFRQGRDIIDDTAADPIHAKINFVQLHQINESAVQPLTGIRKINELKPPGTDVVDGQQIAGTAIADKQALWRQHMPNKFSSFCLVKISHIHLKQVTQAYCVIFAYFGY